MDMRSFLTKSLGIKVPYALAAYNELLKIKSGDVVLPTRSQAGHDNGNVRLRCVTEPDAAQKVLLNRLGIPLPRRLKRINEIAQM